MGLTKRFDSFLNVINIKSIFLPMPKTNIFIESKFDVFGKKEKSNKFVFFSEKIMLKNVINIAFQKLREEEEFVDITLVSEDGTEFTVHQVVLTTVCDKFKEQDESTLSKPYHTIERHQHKDTSIFP